MSVLGIDLGGTQIRAAHVQNKQLGEVRSAKVPSQGTEREVLEELFRLTDASLDTEIQAIGIGVPSLVDVEKGIVYEVQNIPSWKEVHLKKWMEERYHLPVFINNDSNCFALGERYFGQGQNTQSFVGLTIGTGLGSGIIVDGHLYAGPNCGAGEIGMVDYLDHNFEYYASGQFFKNCYDLPGEQVFRKAKKGEKQALRIWGEFGTHLGNAVKAILYTYDPELLILGGSISEAYPFFERSMWQRIKTFAYTHALKTFKISISNLEHSGILGAAALCRDKNFF